MDNSFTMKGDNSNFDAAWYVAAYPDVARANIEPLEHYLRHGQAEGRLPRLLQSKVLEQKLWEGFSGIALPELHTVYRAVDSSRDEKLYAAWALARWYAAQQDWARAAMFIEPLVVPLPGYLSHLGIPLLRIETLLQLGRSAGAKAALSSAIQSYGISPDLYLAAANLYLAGSTDADEQGLECINRIFIDAALTTLRKLDPSRPLTLDNIQGAPSLPTTPAKGGKVSVIMPAYNAANFIATALRSLLAQTWSNLEVLVVDDCSSDDTAQVVNAIAAEDSRVVLIRLLSNVGAYAARNRALSYVTGEFIANHDSDDWSHPQTLECLVNALLAEPAYIGVMAHWVRASTSLHFQRWRMDEGLIEPSISTLLFRRDALALLGGWDEVNVAADSEFHQRLLVLYGPDSVAQIQPGVPLVFARQWPGSLTSAPATHARSEFFGLRRLYGELSATWRKMAAVPDGLLLQADARERRFPAPPAILWQVPPPRQYDKILFADFGDSPEVYPTTRNLLRRLMASGVRVALFHWPDFGRAMPTSIAEYFLARAVEGQVDLLLPEDRVTTDSLLIIGKCLLNEPLDAVPKVRFKRCRVLKLQDISSELTGLTQALISAEDGSLIQDSGLFSARWYLRTYPDVRDAKVDPLQHYLQHGAFEKREPGPDFNTPFYLAQCPQAADSGWSPLLHYLKAGKRLGHKAGHPILPGALSHRAGRPTILLCGHAADVQLFGAERSLLDVLDAFTSINVNVLVSVPSTANLVYIKQLQQRSQEVFAVPCGWWSATEEPCEQTVARFSQIIRDHSVVAVQANTIMLREPLIAARQANIPALVHVHESLEHDADICRSIGLPAEQIRDQVIQNVDHVLANSAFTANVFGSPRNTHVIANTVDLKLFDIANTVQPDCITIALISSNLPKKGIVDLVAIARLLESTSSARLLLIGPQNQHTAALRAHQIAGTLPANLVLAGYSDQPLEAISQANIVLNLSHCQETFGRTLLEAMAARRTVLAYKWGALPELIQDGKNGFLLPLGDVKAVADKLRWLCENPKKINLMGESGRRLARKKFSPAHIRKQLADAYFEVLGGRESFMPAKAPHR